MKQPLVVQLRFQHKTVIWWAAFFMLCVFGYEVVSETLTLTSYYPSPVGAYKKLRSSQSAFFAYQGGNVGIGTDSPEKKLDVAGAVQFRNELHVEGEVDFGGAVHLQEDVTVDGTVTANGVHLGDGGVCSAAWEGKLAYKKGDKEIQFCNGTEWTPLVAEKKVVWQAKCGQSLYVKNHACSASVSVNANYDVATKTYSGEVTGRMVTRHVTKNCVVKIEGTSGGRCGASYTIDVRTHQISASWSSGCVNRRCSAIFQPALE